MEPDSPEHAITAADVYTLLRLALLTRDRRYRETHVTEAALLHLRLALAYRIAGGYVATVGSLRYYHPHTLGHTALRLAYTHGGACHVRYAILPADDERRAARALAAP